MENKDYNFIQPDHYKDSKGDYIDELIRTKGAIRTLWFCEDNADKYAKRLGKKPGETENRERSKIGEYLKRRNEIKVAHKCLNQSEITDLIKDTIKAFNEIPDKKLHNIGITTYSIAERLEILLRQLEGTE